MLLHGAPFFKRDFIPLPYTGVGSAREKTIAVRRNPSPKQNAVLRNSGQGTMSLAGAGQSPQSFTASAVSADRRNLFPHKQVADLRPIAVRQSNAARRNPSLQAKRSLRLTAQRSTRLCHATFPPRTRPRRKAIGADSPPPRPSRQKSRTPSVIRPWFFARQIPAPPVFSCKKNFTTFLFQRLDSPFFAVIQYI